MTESRLNMASMFYEDITDQSTLLTKTVTRCRELYSEGFSDIEIDAAFNNINAVIFEFITTPSQ